MQQGRAQFQQIAGICSLPPKVRVLRCDCRQKFICTEGNAISFLLTAFFAADLLNIIEQTGWVARGVLALLFLFSIVSWAMIFQKIGVFGRLQRESDQFLRIFRATKGVANPQALASAGASVIASPYASIAAPPKRCGASPRATPNVVGNYR